MGKKGEQQKVVPQLRQRLIPGKNLPRDRPDHHRQAAPFSVASDDYGIFLCKLFDLWLSDFSNGRPTTSIRFFESLLFRYAGEPPPKCPLSLWQRSKVQEALWI